MLEPAAAEAVVAFGGERTSIRSEIMKDVKVDVRVNVGVDMAGVVLLLASAAMAMFFYKQNKQEKLTSNAS
jgi:hypothetical protein